MRSLLLVFPTPILALIIVGGSVCLTVVGTLFVRKSVQEDIHRINNQVAGSIFAAISVIYGVLLGFTCIVVWQAFIQAQTNVEREGNSLVNLFRAANELPPPYADDLKRDDIVYGQTIVNTEWTTMAQGQPSAEANQALEAIWGVERRLHVDKVPHGADKDTVFAAIDVLGNQRRIRLLDSRTELPGLMWALLWGGAIVTLSFALFFRAQNLWAQLLMVALLSGIVSFVLLLILELDSPFTGTVHVTPLAIQHAIETMQRLQK